MEKKWLAVIVLAATMICGLGGVYVMATVDWSSGDKITSAKLNTMQTNHRAAGTFSRTVAEGSGAQAITGLGFQPTVIHFIAKSATAGAAHGPISWGYAERTGSTDFCMYLQGDDATQMYQDATASIFVKTAANNQYSAAVTAYGSDGFTVQWTLGGNPGTVTVMYIAF